MRKVNRDAKGRIVPASHLFGEDFGCEVDDYLETRPEEEYERMARKSQEIIQFTLKECGYQNWKACKEGYAIERLRDELQEMAKARKYGRIKIQNADKLLEALIVDLKTIPSQQYFQRDVTKVISILESFRLAEKKREALISLYMFGY